MKPDAFRSFISQILAAADQPIPPVAMIVKCKACGQKNRRVTGRGPARCGKCGLPL